MERYIPKVMLIEYILVGKWEEEDRQVVGMYKDGRKQLIGGVKAAETIEYNDTVNKKEFKQSLMREKKYL